MPIQSAIIGLSISASEIRSFEAERDDGLGVARWRVETAAAASPCDTHLVHRPHHSGSAPAAGRQKTPSIAESARLHSLIVFHIIAFIRSRSHWADGETAEGSRRVTDLKGRLRSPWCAWLPAALRMRGGLARVSSLPLIVLLLLFAPRID
jgi:hypothetical protein